MQRLLHHVNSATYVISIIIIIDAPAIVQLLKLTPKQIDNRT